MEGLQWVNYLLLWGRVRQEVVTYTTRPIRAGETYGKEYFFVSEEEMHEMQEDDKIIECRVYQTVHGPCYFFTANDVQIYLEKGT